MFKKEKDLSPCADCCNLCDYELHYRGKRIKNDICDNCRCHSLQEKRKEKEDNTMKTTLTVYLDNLTDEERELLLKLAGKSHIEKKNKVWKPNEGDTYYCVSYYGQVNDNIYIPTVGGEHYRLGNCFKTKEEAKFALEKQKLITEIKRYIVENDPEKLDWKDENQRKFRIYYDYEDKKFGVDTNIVVNIMNAIYFSNKLDWRKMISDIGEERIKKYLFGVE